MDFFDGSGDVVSERAATIANLADVARRCRDAKTKALVHKTMEALLWSISPPRGEVVPLQPVAEKNEAEKVVRAKKPE